MFDAVVFDLDGTLLDTEKLTQAAGRQAFADCGVAVDPAFLHSTVGRDDMTCAGLIKAQYPALDLDHFAERWRFQVNSHWEQGIPFKPGAQELLAAIRQPIALATSSTRVQLEKKLSINNIARYFQHMISVNDVENPKPAPDPFLKAARLMGVDPARCVAFEDSETGAESAHRAGMTVVQVPDINPTKGRFAHLVAPDLMTGAREIGLLP